MSIRWYTLLELPTVSDERGSLTVLENMLPFSISRLFWIYGADGKIRGGHRHHVTRQALIAISGKVTVFLDNGKVHSTINLDNPRLCLLVEPEDWHTMTFSQDSILLVVASHPYDRNDYIEQRYE